MIPRRVAWLACALLLVSGPSVAQQPAPAKKPVVIATPDFPTDSLGRIIFSRESYAYPREGRRDPFASLIATGDVRPLFSDLRVTGIMYDPVGSSTAMLKDASTNVLYRARVGSVFGRVRITFIRAGQVGVAIDEFGFTRQEMLTLNAPSGGRAP